MQILRRFIHKMLKLWETKDQTQFRAMLKNMAVLAVMVIITVSSVLTVVASTRIAHIVVNGQKTDVEITSEDTEKIILKAGIRVSRDDDITREDGTDGSQDVFITVKTAFPVKIEVDGKTQDVTAHYGDTVDSVLEALGVSVNSDDGVSPSRENTLKETDTVRVVRRYPISVEADGTVVQATVREGTIARALSQAGIVLGPDDKVSADLDTPVGKETKLTVTRVSYKKSESTQTIPFSTVTKKNSSLYTGTTKIKQKGENGLKTVVTQQTLEDGKAVATKVLNETVTKKPVSQVMLVGTKKRAAALASVGSDGTLIDQYGKTVHYKKVLTGRASCYTGGGWTSTGKKAAYGLVAVNPHIIPYGTRLYICSPDGKLVYGYATAADTGGAAMRGAIIADLYYDSYNQCIQIGTRTMNVYIL